MANQNPIELSDYDDPIAFNIPAANSGSTITITVTTSVDDGWKYVPGHSIRLTGKNMSPPVGQEPSANLALGTGSDLKGKQLFVTSNQDIIRDGSANDSTKVKYSLVFSANGTVIERFDCTSSENPANFFTRIKFS